MIIFSTVRETKEYIFVTGTAGILRQKPRFKFTSPVNSRLIVLRRLGRVCSWPCCYRRAGTWDWLLCKHSNSPFWFTMQLSPPPLNLYFPCLHSVRPAAEINTFIMTLWSSALSLRDHQYLWNTFEWTVTFFRKLRASPISYKKLELHFATAAVHPIEAEIAVRRRSGCAQTPLSFQWIWHPLESIKAATPQMCVIVTHSRATPKPQGFP